VSTGGEWQGGAKARRVVHKIANMAGAAGANPTMTPPNDSVEVCESAPLAQELWEDYSEHEQGASAAVCVFSTHRCLDQIVTELAQARSKCRQNYLQVMLQVCARFSLPDTAAVVLARAGPV
jgi:hypothetical protein